MNNPSAAPLPLQIPDSVIAAGDRPLADRRLSQFGTVLLSNLSTTFKGLALVAGLGVSLTLAPSTAEAQSFFGGYSQTKNTSAREYSRDEGLRATDGRLAEVVMVRRVAIENNNSYSMGGVVGAAVGAVAAERIDNSTARNLGRVLLGGLGAAGGHKIQQRVTRRDGVQITVMERGYNGQSKLTNIVQDNDLPIHPGDTVMIEGSGSTQRVVPLDPAFQQRLRGRPLSQAPAVEMGDMESLRQARQGSAGETAPTKRRGFTA